MASQRCLNCDKLHPKISRHHIDGNHNNNAKSNILLLCPSCHTKTHWTIGTYANIGPTTGPDQYGFYHRLSKIRRATPKGGHEISLPGNWVKQLANKDGKLTILYGDVIAIIPPGVKVNRRVLAAAVETEAEPTEPKEV